MPSYSITVTKAGEITIEASSFSGTACLDTAKNLLEALGGDQDIGSNLEVINQSEEASQW
jgi:hypothetical protein